MSIVTTISEEGLEIIGRYYSFYVATVIDNEDPENLHRLKVFIPEINNGFIIWVPPAEDWVSERFYIKSPTPQVDDQVYVIFRMGNVQNGRWIKKGSTIDGKEIPPNLKDINRFGLISYGGNEIWIDDSTGEINVWAQGDIHIDSKSHIIINQGKNEGMIKIRELTQKLNQLVSEIETLRNTFNTHTHSGVQSGPGTTAPPITRDDQPISQFNQEDYENTLITH